MLLFQLEENFMNKLKELSLFFPAYNLEGLLKNTVEKAIPILKRVADKYELIIINDGSKDKTGKIADELARKHSFVRVVHHSFNQGYGGALKSGFYNGKYEWIVFTDGDGQFDFSEIDKLIEFANKADVVATYRLDRQDSLKRKFFGWGWTVLASILLGINLRDVDSGFRMVKKKVIDTIPRLQSSRGGTINPEIFARARKAGFRIVEVGVHHFPRKEGKQTGANLKVIFRSFVDLGKLWWSIK